MPPRPPLPVQLKRIGRYDIVRPLSKGGMALVFEARRKSLAGVSPRVAIKVILPQHADSKTFRQLFINEARVGASMQHQNLVQIQDFDQDENGFFIVMEYVEGVTLREAATLAMRHGVEVPLEVVAELGRQACDGLDYAHTVRDGNGDPLDLVHRDVKPSNLILTPHGIVKILDFGIALARIMNESRGAVRGTWGYMSPEQAEGRAVGPQADVFGLGAVLFELANRGPLFVKKDPDTVKRLLADDHAARMVATLGPGYRPLVGVLVRALQRDPAARYRNAAEFGRELAALMSDPVTVRDSVHQFYETIVALKAGRPIPAARQHSAPASDAPSGATGGSIVATADESPPARARSWLMGAGVFLAVAAFALTALAVVIGLSSMVSSPAKRPAEQAPQVEQPVRTDAPTEDATPAPEPAVPARKARPAPSRPRAQPVVEAAPEPRPTAVRVVRAPVVEPEPVAPEPTVVVTAPEAEEVTVVKPPTPTGPGYVTIAATIPGSEVYIDGRFVRKVPLVDYQLDPGEYAVGITAPNGLSHRFRITVISEASTTWNWDFDRQEFKAR